MSRDESLRQDLKAFLDGELSPARTDEVRKALESDPLLAEEARLLKEIGTAVRQQAWQPAPVGLEATLAKLSGSKVSRRNGLWWFALPASLATGLFVLVLLRPGGDGAEMAVSMNQESAKISADASASSIQSAEPTVAVEERARDSKGFDRQGEGELPKSGPGGASTFESRVTEPVKDKSTSASGRPTSVEKSRRSNQTPPAAQPKGKSAPSPNRSTFEEVVAEKDKIVLVVEVESLEIAETKLREITERLGGEFSGRDAGASDASRRVALRVPESSVEEARKEIPQLSKEITTEAMPMARGNFQSDTAPAMAKAPPKKKSEELKPGESRQIEVVLRLKPKTKSP